MLCSDGLGPDMSYTWIASVEQYMALRPAVRAGAGETRGSAWHTRRAAPAHLVLLASSRPRPYGCVPAGITSTCCIDMPELHAGVPGSRQGAAPSGCGSLRARWAGGCCSLVGYRYHNGMQSRETVNILFSFQATLHLYRSKNEHPFIPPTPHSSCERGARMGSRITRPS